MPHEKNTIHLIGHIVYVVLYCLLVILSIPFYNSANLVAILYMGWIILVFGVIILLSASQSRKKSSVLKNEINKEALIESGIYAFVRHPEFLGHILIIFSLILITQHIINLVIGIALIFLLYFAMIEEEKRNIKKFGKAYEDYMRRTPRINLLVGIIRRVYAKKEKKI